MTRWIDCRIQSRRYIGGPIRRKQVNTLGAQAWSQVLELDADNKYSAHVRELIAVAVTSEHAPACDIPRTEALYLLSQEDDKFSIQNTQHDLGYDGWCISFQCSFCVIEEELTYVAICAALTTGDREVDAWWAGQVDQYAREVVRALFGVCQHGAARCEAREKNAPCTFPPECSGKTIIIRAAGRFAAKLTSHVEHRAEAGE